MNHNGHKTICANCKFWLLIDIVPKIGLCNFFNKNTEWCAGINWQTRNRLKICDGFKQK